MSCEYEEEGWEEVSRSRNIESVIASNGIEANEYKIGGEGLFVCRSYWLIIQYLMMKRGGRDRGAQVRSRKRIDIGRAYL